MLSRISGAFDILKKMNDTDKKYYRLSVPQLSQMGEMIKDVETFMDSILRMKSVNVNLFRQLNEMARLFKVRG